MKYVTLGRTGLKVSVVSFGGIPIQRADAANTKAVVDRMEAHGINYIDTARGYTVSEEYLGAALEGRRDKFILATKSMARDKESMARDIETSLSNLRTGHIVQVFQPEILAAPAAVVLGDKKDGAGAVPVQMDVHGGQVPPVKHLYVLPGPDQQLSVGDHIAGAAPQPDGVQRAAHQHIKTHQNKGHAPQNHEIPAAADGHILPVPAERQPGNGKQGCGQVKRIQQPDLARFALPEHVFPAAQIGLYKGKFIHAVSLPFSSVPSA